MVLLHIVLVLDPGGLVIPVYHPSIVNIKSYEYLLVHVIKYSIDISIHYFHSKSFHQY